MPSLCCRDRHENVQEVPGHRGCPQCNKTRRAEGEGLSDTHKHMSHVWPEWDIWMGDTEGINHTKPDRNKHTKAQTSREGDMARETLLDPDRQTYTHTYTHTLLSHDSSCGLAELYLPLLPQRGKKHFQRNATFHQRPLRSYKFILLL